MSDFTPFHKVIKERATNPNANNYEIPWWNAEIFDDLMETTRSVELLNFIRE